MPVFRIEIVDGSRQTAAARDEALVLELREAGLAQLKHVRSSRLFFLEGTLTRPIVEEIAACRE